MLSLAFRLHESFPGYSEIFEVISNGPVLLQIFSIVILAPVLEEVLCRGIIYNRLREISNFFISALVSSLIWSAAHMNVVQGFTAILFGIFLAFLYEKFKMLQVTIISHGFFNLIPIAFSNMLPENGQSISEMDFDLSDNMTVLVVYLLVTAGLIFLMKRSRFPRSRPL